MSRAAWLNCQHRRSCALVLTLFLFQKGQGFFPPLPIAALLPRSWHWAGSKKCKLGCFGRDWVASQRQKASFFFSLSLALYILNQRCWDDSMLLGYFRNTKSQRNFISTLAFYASHEARRRMAVCITQLTGSHTRPASRGTRRATAVTPHPSRMSLECPRALRARCGVQGVTPCCEP